MSKHAPTGFTFEVENVIRDTTPEGVKARTVELTGERWMRGHLLPTATPDQRALFERCEAHVLAEFAAFYEASRGTVGGTETAAQPDLSVN